MDGNGAQISPCGDGPDGDANAQDLDAGAQNARLRSKQDALPNTCVYVGFLGWWVTEKDLMEYFSPYGHLVSVRVSVAAAAVGWGRGGGVMRATCMNITGVVP